MKEIAYAGAVKLAIYLKRTISEDYTAVYPHILPSDANEETLAKAQEIYYKRTNKTILECCHGNDVAETLVQLAFLLYLYPEAAKLLYIVSTENKYGVTLETAAKVTGKEYDETQIEISDAFGKLESVFLWKNENNNLITYSFYIDFTLAAFISNQIYVPDESFNNLLHVSEGFRSSKLPILYQEEYKQIIEAWQEGFWLVQIRGERESGRKELIHNITDAKGLTIMEIDAKYLFDSMEPEERNQRIHLVCRDSYLLQSVVCINDFTMDRMDQGMKIPKEVWIWKEFCRMYRRQEKTLFVTTDKETNLYPFLSEVQLQVKLNQLTSQQSKCVWRHLAKLRDVNLSKDILDQIAEQMILPVGAINKVLMNPSAGQADENSIFELCYQAQDDGRFDGINRVHSSFTRKDLILDQRQKSQIDEIIHAIHRRKKIFENESLQELFPYGRSITALFSGSPGTGKTMAAHVIANEVHLPLFKVNLSEVMDKYIGESEKRLEKIFAQAEHGNLILFFDEADALIGKRSEITDAKDRYANATVSFILQRIEEFNGIIIMATNFSNNIDDAFMRRIQYSVNFSNLSSEMRRKLWLSMIEKVGHDSIDYDMLCSEAYNFSPAILKNIFLHAVYLLEEGELLTMSQIAQSAANEYEKMGRSGIPECIRQDMI